MRIFKSNYTIILYIIIQNMCKERKKKLKIFPV